MPTYDPAYDPNGPFIDLDEVGSMWLSNDVMLNLLGGKWPEYKGFMYSQVYMWRIEAGGYVLPYSGGLPMDGPMFKLVRVGEIIADDPDSFCKSCGQLIGQDAERCPDCGEFGEDVKRTLGTGEK